MNGPRPRGRRWNWVSGYLGSPEGFSLTRWLFLRGLGLVYLAAFLSLSTQITGLVGSRGLLPVRKFTSELTEQFGGHAFFRVPTLLWLNQGDGFLHLLCGAGAVLAVLVLLDFLTLPALAGMWALYLSLFYAGQDFLGFQWDLLLLETGFAAVLFAPLHLWPRRQTPVSLPVLWLLRLLLFRLMLGAGVVKLASGDPTWRDLTATTYHYQTQPLPSLLGWWMHHLPLGFHRVEVVFTFFAELIVPWLIFAPRVPRMVSGLMMIALQLLIILTGNYSFFNWLTILLCLTLFDDAFLRRLVPAGGRRRMVQSVQGDVSGPRRIVPGLIAAVLLALNGVQLSRQMLPGVAVPGPLLRLQEGLEPYFLVNTYGLFATMTTQRHEIVLEGSRDGTHWLSYEFRYKPGDPHRAPVWVAPHQPRLDWQMWFAALQGDPGQTPWMGPLALRLLQGEPEVLRLLGKNPFPAAPPRYVRAQLYGYVYTTPPERRATGDWWKRQLLGLYFLPVSLKDLNAAPATSPGGPPQGGTEVGPRAQAAE
ncbi:lipase maturation factor family protein [Deinococcus hopiensis]|uniref:lipase maturation factor family protein n=1 Tax=Deinococcus hopiensis TaxID=309885 RepID=UPI001483724E|nr:lipase maturation factor family protein [Deinococcus hopiensis]